MKGLVITILICFTAWVTVATAAESTGIEGTSIIGNRELPKVLYIVPWKPAQPGALVVRPFASLYDQSLEPADREVLLRELGYFSARDQKHKLQRQQ